MGVDRWGVPGWYDSYTGKWTSHPFLRMNKRQLARDKKHKRDADNRHGLGGAPPPTPLLPLLHPHMQEAAATTTTIWRRAVADEPIVVDVDVAAEEPADQEPLGRPAEDKEAELDAKKRALNERERGLGRRRNRRDAASAAPGTLLSFETPLIF